VYDVTNNPKRVDCNGADANGKPLLSNVSYQRQRQGPRNASSFASPMMNPPNLARHEYQQQTDRSTHRYFRFGKAREGPRAAAEDLSDLEECWDCEVGNDKAGEHRNIQWDTVGEHGCDATTAYVMTICMKP